MSRRSRHGRRPQSSTSTTRPGGFTPERPTQATATVPELVQPAPTVDAAASPHMPQPETARPGAAPEPAPRTEPAPHAEAAPHAEPAPRAEAAPAAPAAPDVDASRTTCTQAQLRRFIKSRPWIPMHELRRRFGISGGDDDVTPVRIGDTTIFVGLPAAEGGMLGELLVGGDVGYELSLDPGAPIVVGVYPMRPVPRG